MEASLCGRYQRGVLFSVLDLKKKFSEHRVSLKLINDPRWPAIKETALNCLCSTVQCINTFSVGNNDRNLNFTALLGARAPCFEDLLLSKTKTV